VFHIYGASKKRQQGCYYWWSILLITFLNSRRHLWPYILGYTHQHLWSQWLHTSSDYLHTPRGNRYDLRLILGIIQNVVHRNVMDNIGEFAVAHCDPEITYNSSYMCNAFTPVKTGHVQHIRLADLRVGLYNVDITYVNFKCTVSTTHLHRYIVTSIWYSVEIWTRYFPATT
jgi:hypothetical protein